MEKPIFKTLQVGGQEKLMELTRSYNLAAVF